MKQVIPPATEIMAKWQNIRKALCSREAALRTIKSRYKQQDLHIAITRNEKGGLQILNEASGNQLCLQVRGSVEELVNVVTVYFEKAIDDSLADVKKALEEHDNILLQGKLVDWATTQN